MSKSKPLSFFDRLCDEDEKQEKGETFKLYHKHFQFCEIPTEEENKLLPNIYFAYDLWHYWNQSIKKESIITQEMINEDKRLFNKFKIQYDQLDLNGKAVVMLEKRPLVKYSLEELRKLIPSVQDWHLLYYLMYKHEWDEDVINYKF